MSALVLLQPGAGSTWAEGSWSSPRSPPKTNLQLHLQLMQPHGRVRAAQLATPPAAYADNVGVQGLRRAWREAAASGDVAEGHWLHRDFLLHRSGRVLAGTADGIDSRMLPRHAQGERRRRSSPGWRGWPVAEGNR